MSKMKMASKVKYVSFNWRFPMSMYSVMENESNKIYIEWLKGVQLPPEFIQHAKVLPGGMQFSLLVGVPR
jgi:ABC-type proline/glycine betaine transport system ATPase subunit